MKNFEKELLENLETKSIKPNTLYIALFIYSIIILIIKGVKKIWKKKKNLEQER